MATAFRKLNPLSAFIALTLSFTVLSCKEPNQEGGVRIPLPADSSSLSKINHFIPVEDVEKFKKSFTVLRDTLSRSNPGLFIPVSEAFNKQAIINLLKDSTNVGLRVYYGVKEGGNSNELRVILVGVNSKGEDLYYEEEQSVTGKAAAKAPPPAARLGGIEYGQCSPPCH